MIRPAKLTDISSIYAIEKEVLYDRWQIKDFLYELNDNPVAQLYVYENKEKEIIGFFDIWLIFERMELVNIGLFKNEQAKGYGEEMLTYIENIARDNKCEYIFLELRESNTIAKKLYDKHNFLPLRVKKGYYREPDEDALEMIKTMEAYND